MSSEQIELYCESVMDPLENSSVSIRCAAATFHPPAKHCGVKQVVFQLQGLTLGAEAQTPQALQRYVLNINLKQGKNLVAGNKRSGEAAARHSGPDYRWLVE